MVALQGSQGPGGKSFDVLAGWQERADDAQGGAVQLGHCIAEEAPEAVVETLIGLAG